MEDSDIKIFGKEQNSGNDELKFIALMEKERSNGNIDEAVRLGDYLSDIFLDEEGLLQNGDSAFYTEFSDGAEYSFYYLAMRKESQSVITEIGKAFAMLCGKENDQSFVELGKKLFNLVSDEVADITNMFNFVDA